jgi:hypothetical protein
VRILRMELWWSNGGEATETEQGWHDSRNILLGMIFCCLQRTLLAGRLFSVT